MDGKSREQRGKTNLITFVLQYPDGELKAAPVNALGIKEIVIDSQEIERRIGADATLPNHRLRQNVGELSVGKLGILSNHGSLKQKSLRDSA